MAGPQPEIPSRAVGLSLLLGEVVQVPSFLQLEEETKTTAVATVGGLPRTASATIPLAMSASG